MGRTGHPTWLLAAALVAAGPALADVKAGVDAWTRGDYTAAVREWQEPAARGDPDAQFNLAQAYKLGRGVEQDLARAEELFGKAARQGHLQASDNYGLLLFQRGQRAEALPYIRAAADRGDPRAQYLLGVAHFNGDGVPRDWVRAYALTSLARQAGLPQASSALAQMDQYIPLEQRQQAATLAAALASQAEATRTHQLAAAELGAAAPAGPPVAKASSIAGADSPRTAGADFARPQTPASAPVTVQDRPSPRPVQPSAASGGAWRVQLGAFSVAGNAEALWKRVKDRPELSGRRKLLVPSGRLTKLQAGGFASHAEAQAACARLSAAGFTCLAVGS